MIPYLFESTICWLVFYGFYLLVLERETFFTLNRFYLLITVLLGLVFPLLEFSWWQSFTGDSTMTVMMQPVTVTMSQVGYTLQEIVVTPDKQQTTYFGQILLGIYLIGVVLSTCRLAYGIWGINQLKRKSIIYEKIDHTLVETNNIHLPFSFFRDLFWSKKLELSTEDKERILRHELTHIRQYHSVDIIFLKIISILFWFNPILWFYKKAIRDTHEYLADEQVLVQHKKKQYGQLLLRQMQSGTAFSLTHNFNHSQLKKRFQMMNKNKSSRWAMTRYIWALPIFALLLLAFKASDMLPQNSQNPILPAQQFHVNQSPGDSIFNKVDQMPTFPECEDVVDFAERKPCADQKMLQHIYTKIKYPELARETGTQGTVVVQFVVNKKGEIVKPRVLKSIGYGCDVEVLRVVETMPKWNPGINKGEKVDVYFNLPIKFKLQSDAPTADQKKTAPSAPITLSVFPNPTPGEVKVSLQAEAQPITLYISDIKGEILKEETYSAFSGKSENAFDLTKLGVTGTLFITIKQGDQIKTEQIILN